MIRRSFIRCLSSLILGESFRYLQDRVMLLTDVRTMFSTLDKGTVCRTLKLL
jgi:hypothetical protein